MRWYVITNLEKFLRDACLGPDALDIKAAQFKDILKSSKGSIKKLLMDQHLLSGIGNAYSNEILFQAKIHPKTPGISLSDTCLTPLYKATTKVLNEAVRLGTDRSKLPAKYLLPHRYGDRLCPLCDHQLKFERVSGRGVLY